MTYQFQFIPGVHRGVLEICYKDYGGESMKKNKQPLNNQITIYQSPDGGVNIEVLYADENIWLTQKLIAQLFDVDVRTVNEHLKNIFLEQELVENSVIRKFRITATDGKEYKTN